LRGARRREGFDGYARRLLGACHLDQVLLDDGFVFPGSLGLAGSERLFGCPVRRVVRIEREAEAAAEGWPPFADLRARFRDRVSAALEGSGGAPAAGLKTIAAYRSGLDLPPADAAAAASAYR